MGSRYESGVNTMGVLSRTEQKLVEEHLYLIRPLVLNVVHLNENVQGLGYDDLYQTACEALCHAAMKYQDSRGASFPTFASIVIRNTLLSLLRHQQLSTAELIQCMEKGSFHIRNSRQLMEQIYAEETSDCDSIVTEGRTLEIRRPVLTAVANLYLKQLITLQIL